MKTLEDIKDEYANECGRDSWEDYFKWNELCHMPLSHMQVAHDEIAKRFALEVAKEALKNAADNAKLDAEWSYSVNDVVHSVDKQSIIDENNIPKI